MSQPEQTATAPTEEPSPLDIACYNWATHKAEEAAANAARLEDERVILSLVGCKQEGATHGEATYYKAKTTGNLTRKLVDDYGQRIDAMDPEHKIVTPTIIAEVIKYKPALDVTAFKALAAANPDAYRIMCNVVDTKPAKASVSVELKVA